jgi:hypothetical protein
VGSGSYSGWRGGKLWTFGRRPGHRRTRIELGGPGGEIREVPVDEHGFWIVTEDVAREELGGPRAHLRSLD